MLRQVILALSLFLLAVSVHAGFDDGLAAYDKGEHAVALKAFTQAAEQGDSRAFGRLGGMYLYGVGTARDMVMAYVWFDLAASLGDVDAAKFRDAAAEQLSVSQLREATARAEDFYDKYVLPYKD